MASTACPRAGCARGGHEPGQVLRRTQPDAVLERNAPRSWSGSGASGRQLGLKPPDDVLARLGRVRDNGVGTTPGRGSSSRTWVNRTLPASSRCATNMA